MPVPGGGQTGAPNMRLGCPQYPERAMLAPFLPQSKFFSRRRFFHHKAHEGINGRMRNALKQCLTGDSFRVVTRFGLASKDCVYRASARQGETAF